MENRRRMIVAVFLFLMLLIGLSDVRPVLAAKAAENEQAAEQEETETKEEKETVEEDTSDGEKEVKEADAKAEEKEKKQEKMEPALANAAAMKSYLRLLSKEKITFRKTQIDPKKIRYTMYDVDQDGIQELFLKYPVTQKVEDEEKTTVYTRIYTYDPVAKKGKYLFETTDRLFVYEKGGIVCLTGQMSGSNWASYYELKDSEFIKKIYMTGTVVYDMLPEETESFEVAPGDGDTIYFYDFEADDEIIECKEAKKLVNGIEKGNKVADIGEYLRNTKKNRKISFQQ